MKLQHDGLSWLAEAVSAWLDTCPNTAQDAHIFAYCSCLFTKVSLASNIKTWRR